MITNDLDKPHCHCAVFGVFGSPTAAQLSYLGLIAQQHRGQEGSGIVTADSDDSSGKTRFHVHKDFGLVDDVYRQERLLSDVLKGSSAIGHNQSVMKRDRGRVGRVSTGRTGRMCPLKSSAPSVVGLSILTSQQ